MDNLHAGAALLQLITGIIFEGPHLIRDVARMEAGKLSVELTAVAPQQLIEEAVELHGGIAEQKDLDLRAGKSDPLPEIAADRSRILQVLQNLIGNAIKFTPPGGKSA